MMWGGLKLIPDGYPSRRLLYSRVIIRVPEEIARIFWRNREKDAERERKQGDAAERTVVWSRRCRGRHAAVPATISAARAAGCPCRQIKSWILLVCASARNVATPQTFMFG